MLEERTGEYFDKTYPSPFMLLTYDVLPDKRDEIPAPTHVDGTGRLQTVNRDQNERYYDLITRLRRAHRRAGPAEHELQRERADLLHPRGSRRHVRPDEDGPARTGKLRRRSGRPLLDDAKPQTARPVAIRSYRGMPLKSDCMELVHEAGCPEDFVASGIANNACTRTARCISRRRARYSRVVARKNTSWT